MRLQIQNKPLAAPLRIGAIGLLYLIWSNNAFAAETTPNTYVPPSGPILTIKEVLESLKKTSYRWKQIDEAIPEAEAKASQAKAALLPHFSFGMREIVGRVNLLQYGITELNGLDYFSFGATVLQMSYSLFDLSSSSRVDAANQYSKSAQYNTESNQNEFTFYLLSQYTLTQKWQSLIKNRSKAVENIENLKQLAEEKVRSEVGIDLDVKRAQTRLAMARVKFLDSVGNFEKAKRDLAGLLGVEAINRPVEDIEKMIPLAFDPEKLAPQDVLESRPDRKANHLLAESAQNMVKSEERLRWPRVDFIGEFGIAGTTIFDGGSNGLVGTAGIFLTMPLYTGGFISAKESEARANESKATLQNDQLAIDIQNQFQGSVYQYSLARKALEVSQQGAELASDELKLTKRRFQLGIGGNFDIITSQASFSQAQDDLTEAWFNYRLATLQILKVSNKLQSFLEAQ